MRKITVIRIAAVTVAVGFAGWGYGCGWHTFVRWWEPVVAALLIGGGLCRMLGRPAAWLMPRWPRVAVLAITALWVASVVYGSGLALNYYLADGSTTRSVEATVTGRHSEERTKYARRGRRASVSTGTYTVYYLSLRFDNGETRDFAVSAGEYARTRTGQIQHFTVEKGFLGYDIFKNRRR